MVRENSNYIAKSLPYSQNIEIKWDSDACAIFMSYYGRGTESIKICDNGAYLLISTIPEDQSDEVQTVFQLCTTLLKLIQTDLKKAFGKESERLLKYVID